MPDLDDLLQQKLTALENGEPIEKVLADLSEEDAELIPLLRLAASVRNLPQPEFSQLQTQAGREKVLAAAREITRPASQVLAGKTLPPLPAPAPARRAPVKQPGFNWRDLFRPGFGLPALALGSMAAMFIGAVILMTALVFWLAGPAGARAATLMDVSGQVQIASSDTSNDWRLIDNGSTVKMGQRIRTAGASSVTLVFFEGSRTVVGPNSDLTLSKINGRWGGVLQALLYQRSGKTVNSVVPLKGKTSQFIVNTPSGSASVHGTRFDVVVGNKGESRFTVSTGKVQVSNEQSNVFITAGQVTQAIPGEVISAAAYQFSVQGDLTAIDGSNWTVAGVTFSTNPYTQIDGTFQVGAKVAVEGHLESNGNRVADTVSASTGGAPSASFTGPIQAMAADHWQVGGSTVAVTSATDLPAGANVGDVVKVVFRVLGNGTWQASSITPLAEPSVQPAANPSATPDPNAKPDLEFQSDEIETNNCSNDITLTGTLANQASSEKDIAANVQLGYLIDKGGEWVNSVEITPDGWATIPAKGTVTFTIHVTMLDGWQNAGSEQNQIKLRVTLASETNQPGHLKSTLTAAIQCGQHETETPEPTGGPELAPSSPAAPAANCTGANPQPEGLRLSRQYDVTYEEIMGWFCQGFGFGEIDLAYSLSEQYGKPVAQIFDMRKSGMGWGEIKQFLAKGAQPGEDQNNNNNNGNKGNSGDKGKPTKKP